MKKQYKECKQCKELKSLHHFSRYDFNEDGRKNICVKCTIANNKPARTERLNDRRFLNQFLPI